MKLLLDTHIFIWSAGSVKKPSATVQTALVDRNNSIFLSLASVWEMQLKLQTGKLTLPLSLQEAIEEQQQTNALQILPIKLEHVYELEKLPFHHKDPFNRILIAQAQVENLTLVSVDPHFPLYPVKIL